MSRVERASGSASPRHESAIGHVTGAATYVDEQHPPAGLLSLWPVQSPHAHARILDIDASRARTAPGVCAILTAQDVPGENDTGPILHDEPLIPASLVEFHGQAVAWVVAEDEAAAQAAAALAQVRYEVLPARLTLHDAIAQEQFHLPPARVTRGDAETALAGAPHRLQGEIEIGGQDHFYLETQASWVQIDGEGLVHVTASTQHPTETQLIVARVLGIPAHRVVCRCLRMGGGFGGKETQANPYAAVAAVAAAPPGGRCGSSCTARSTCSSPASAIPSWPATRLASMSRACCRRCALRSTPTAAGAAICHRRC
jgi:xanthine dehydrogenase large subunit